MHSSRWLPKPQKKSAHLQARRDVVLTALRDLPERQREVVALRYYLDLSETDIASTLGISHGSVKSHAFRGLAALKLTLGSLLEDPA
jgi:RNA polymerase sigma factor (sigma-70 family)